jgi:hypothetical protein
MTNLEADILDIIKGHVGYERAINQEEIADEYIHNNIVYKNSSFTVNRAIGCRQVRKVIAGLIRQGYPIISTPRNGGGYCWMSRGEEGLECAKRIQRQAVKLFLKARKIKANSRVGQLVL